MSHRKASRNHGTGTAHPDVEAGPPRLELVLKADTAGTLEAVASALAAARFQGVDVRIVDRGIGDVAKSDLLMATTSSRLVLGFQVGTRPKVEELAREHGVEVRLYDVIYHMVRDLEATAPKLLPQLPTEEVFGSARVIAIFKSSRKGIILGCQVLDGRLVRGKRFRVISAAGVLYEGVLESLHIEQNAVEEAKAGQQVGVKIEGFKTAKVGDLVECYEPPRAGRTQVWSPQPGVRRIDA